MLWVHCQHCSVGGALQCGGVHCSVGDVACDALEAGTQLMYFLHCHFDVQSAFHVYFLEGKTQFETF